MELFVCLFHPNIHQSNCYIGFFSFIFISSHFYLFTFNYYLFLEWNNKYIGPSW